ncbi:MAG: DUF3122 domain-containing protein [Jaaginema sp. PMC 1079.18]|nr:DUF3122 domain-containing protein [Jaaginema sp. PMC 1080.18]MEC4850955.1 DUF3122 domain-containing protein [Jaaginema sp. PMC 1079.18]MEC4867770.1 DUF3122 domain-containing protein [Jaaginema sp. PMC 1078.18]
MVILLFCGLGKLPAAPAFAVVASHQEAPGQILYKSRHTIRDNNSNSWQLIVFKQIQPGQVSSTYLRLVGFPGTVEFKHPHPLKITVQTREFLAEDVFAQQAPGANIGQYDIASVLPHLQLGQRVKLEIPVNNAFPLSLAVPAEIVWEWQDIAAKGTENS